MALWAGALPWRGRGAGFFVLSVGMQLAFFATTQLGEGCPVCKGDAIVGFSAALLASLAGSLILNLVRVRLVRAIVAWGAALDRARRVPCPHRQPRYALTAVPNVFDAFARTLGNRPPPASLPA